MKKLLAVVCVTYMTLSLITACNTVRGVGKDVSKGGQEIQRL